MAGNFEHDAVRREQDLETARKIAALMQRHAVPAGLIYALRLPEGTATYMQSRQEGLLQAMLRVHSPSSTSWSVEIAYDYMAQGNVEQLEIDELSTRPGLVIEEGLSVQRGLEDPSAAFLGIESNFLAQVLQATQEYYERQKEA